MKEHIVLSKEEAKDILRDLTNQGYSHGSSQDLRNQVNHLAKVIGLDEVATDELETEFLAEDILEVCLSNL